MQRATKCSNGTEEGENDASAGGHRDDSDLDDPHGPAVVAQQATRREGASRPRPLGCAGSDKAVAVGVPAPGLQTGHHGGPMPAVGRMRGSYQPVGSKLIPTKSDQTPSTKFLFFPRCLFLLRK